MSFDEVGRVRGSNLVLICELVLLAWPAVVVADGGSWPAWRGDGSGISGEKNIPTYWTTETNILWKIDPLGEGNSSPIVHAGRVYLTAASEEGKKRWVLSYDAKTGKPIWQTELTADRVANTDPKNGYASPTPITDGKNIYAFFDSPGLVALDMNGNVQWVRDVGPFKTPWNMASSPTLCNDMVIVVCDQHGQGFIVGVDKGSGEIRWKTQRDPAMGFATPVVITNNGNEQIVVNGGKVVDYNPVDGSEQNRHLAAAVA